MSACRRAKLAALQLLVASCIIRSDNSALFEPDLSIIFADQLQDKLHVRGDALQESVTDHRRDNAIPTILLKGI